MKQINMLTNFLQINKYRKNRALKKWKYSTALDMKKLFAPAVVLAMVIITQIDISENWTVNPVTSTPFFSSVMSSDKCLSSSCILHLNDN